MMQCDIRTDSLRLKTGRCGGGCLQVMPCNTYSYHAGQKRWYDDDDAHDITR